MCNIKFFTGFLNTILLKSAVFLLAGLTFGGTNAIATPIGDEYLVSGLNFPNDFTNASATFNATLDMSIEAAAGVLVTEQFFDTPKDLTIFEFQLTAFPTDLFANFGFLISDLDFGDGLQRELDNAMLSIDFGVSQFGPTDITALTTVFDADGLWISFTTPGSWDSIFQSTSPGVGAMPTQIVTQLQLEFNRIPEPSTIGLLFIACIALLMNGYLPRQRRVKI